MDKAIIFLDTNKSGSSREAIKAAKRLGYFVILFTRRKKFLKQRKEFSDIDEILIVNLTNVEKIRELVVEKINEGLDIHCITSFIDPYVYVASQLCTEFCEANPISLDAVKAMEDKMITRRLLRKKKYTPLFIELNENDALDDWIEIYNQELPLIIKSPKSTGSKDVVLVNNKKELKQGIRSLRKNYPNQPVLIEEYIIGPQYLVEVIVHKGEIHIVAVIEQEITIGERFIITGYSISSEIEPSIFDGLVKTVKQVVMDFKMKNGACHLELRRVNEDWKLIETNPRISGGAMNRMIEEAYGINLVEQTLRLYLGEAPNLTKAFEKCIYTHYIIVHSVGKLLKVTGKNRAKKHDGVLDVFIKPRKGQLLLPPRSMGHRYGYVMSEGNTKREAKAIAIHAASQIRFYLQALDE
ncbi:ATP-grasp domain-containing protein [Gracilibacillus saliphilus]|uniref:ATP-grasp domain-containing protein n=1 Tax=Gracilibacillus saliphilus TaxID=543890 RepID=UPI0013D0196D|nr:ATP-grasp domain-containing protein [Gracilibacillus saliphilus]